jgi:thioesterase domain-containing protein
MSCRAVSKWVARLGWQVKFCRLLESGIWTRFQATRFMLRLELEEILRMQAFNRWVAQAKPRLPITGTIFACNRHSCPPDLGWNSVFAQLEVIPISGGHLDLVIEPHLAINLPVIRRAVATSCS